ncbi:sugar ABC transporter ATP-binding protein [Umezawaea sp. NPDC059074]|uniref:sugar ABC transporter ATP-binding protein n=1 Tax=Umezawaea sp. NPDC059074 TaxID=3346716 RepID=UPI00368DB863
MTAVLEARGIDVRFGGVHALRDVDLVLRAGRVHALLGENGAGKSTLIKCLGGLVRPTAGTLAWEGRTVDLAHPADARRLGISVLHQELELAPVLSVAENLALGRLPGTRWGVLRRDRLRATAQRALDLVGAEFGLDDRVGELEVADQQLVEIARALSPGDTRVLVMDEPTAALPPAQIDRLLDLVGRIARQGVAVLYVSHRLDEVLAIADDVTVLRDGERVSHGPRSAHTRDTLIAEIVGHVPDEVVRHAVPVGGHRILSLDGVGVGVVHDVTAHACAGEVVGFFGLLGAGQQQLAEAVFGLRHDVVGTVESGGARTAPRSPREAIARGTGFVPADRKDEGLALGLPLAENLLLGAPDRGSRGLVAPRAEVRLADAVLRAAGVALRSAGQPANELSGGNQQKVVLARWMRRPDLRLLLLTEPTRGVDVGAKAEIHHRLRDWVSTVDHERAVVLFSADPEETAAVCDRVYVLSRGRVVGELAGAAVTEAALTATALRPPAPVKEPVR